MLHKAAVESQTSRAISAVAILLCLSFLVSLDLQYWSVGSSKKNRPAKITKKQQELLFLSKHGQLCLCVGVCVGGVSAPLHQ